MSKAPSILWPLSAKAAIFDFDGTIAHTSQIWHLVDMAFLGKRGLPYTDDYPERLAALGFKGGARYTIERFKLNETVEEVCAEWTRTSRDLYQANVELRPGVADYIDALRNANVPCALATTNGANVLGAMRNVSVASLFDTCVYGEDVRHGKDHPDIYLEAARRLQVRPEDCIVFEDITPAVRSAKSIGMRTCGVRSNDPLQNAEELMALADVWLENWLDIPLDRQ